jgi:hypothetical protein
MMNQDQEQSWAGPELEDEPVCQTAIERAKPDGVQTYETASTALAAAAKASVEARFLLALRNPRDIEDVRVRLLKDCKRPRFAEAARYRKPKGKKKDPVTGRVLRDDNGEPIPEFLEGPSARFAEDALRHLGNLQVEAPVIYDDDSQRILRVVATDLETNATTSGDVNVTKTVERRNLKKGQKPLRTRTNSYGDLVYVVAATDDEIADKANAAVSKMRRNLILQLLPADILEECMDQCIATQKQEHAEDPDAARRRMLDAFAQLGVKPSELAQYIGHDTAALNPGELADLRAVFHAIKDGETTWRDVMTALGAEADPEDEAAKKRSAQTQAIIDKHAKKAAKKQQAAAESTTTREPGQEG